MTSLLDLPNELLYSTTSTHFDAIFNLLEPADWKNIRWTCRRFRDVVAPTFRTHFFTTINVSIDSYGLSKLNEIASHRPTARCVETIRFMFDDISENDIYPTNVDQIRLGHTVGSLASSFNKFINCTEFVYALRHYDDAIIAKWACLLSHYTGVAVDFTPEVVARAWLTVTLDALFNSSLDLQSLIIDNHPSTICLPPIWVVNSDLIRLHAAPALNLDKLRLRINLETEDSVEEGADTIAGAYSILESTPEDFGLDLKMIDSRTHPDFQQNHEQTMETVIAMKNFQTLTIDSPGVEAPLNCNWLQEIATNSRGSLIHLRWYSPLFSALDLPVLLPLLERITSQNPGLASIDFAPQFFRHFHWQDDKPYEFRVSLRLHDARPHAYGSLLLQDEIDMLRKFMIMAKIN